MPTRDEDWYRLIEGRPPPPGSGAADGWLDFEAFVDMESARAAHDAIAQADIALVRRALLAAVISRRGIPLTPEQRVDWLQRDATPEDLLGLGDF